MTLSLSPIGIVLPSDVVFTLSGSEASVGHYRLPSSVTLAAGTNSVDILVNALTDTILFNSEPLEVSASNIYLGAVSSMIEIMDTTGDNPANRVITIGNETIFLDGTVSVDLRLPNGITVLSPLTVSLSMGSSSDVSQLLGPPLIGPMVVVIPGGGNSGSFSVTASNSGTQPSQIIIDGSVTGTSISFTVNSGIVTVLDQKVNIVAALSDNGDGINDCLTISNIEKFPDNRVDIVDRYGVTIYSIEHYDNMGNNFCGVSNVGLSYHVPSGTYYYVIRLIDKRTDPNNTKEEKYYKFFEVRNSNN